MQIKRDVPRIMREPLFIFILFSAALYVIFLAQKPIPENEIIVSEARLREFYQYKSQSFGLPAIANKLEVMSTEERDALKEDFIRAKYCAGSPPDGVG